MKSVENSITEPQGPEKLSRSILVAEDNPELRIILKKLLEHKYSDVEVVEDGQILLDKLNSSKKYDVAVMGHDIQKRTSDQVLHKIRSTPELENLPVVVMTVDSEAKLDTRTTYISKLRNIGNLSETIEKMTERK